MIIVVALAVVTVAVAFLGFVSPAFFLNKHLPEKTQPPSTTQNDLTNNKDSTTSLQNSLTDKESKTTQVTPPATNEKTVPKPADSSPKPTGPMANVVWSLPVTERAVFITIDDGWYPNQALLKMMQEKHFPVTAFLIEQAAKEHPDYWRAFVAAGGDIENHTLTHPELTKVSQAELVNQVTAPMNYFAQLAAKPTLFRPPYGSYNSQVQQVVYSAGIKHLVMWNSVMDKGILTTYNGKPIQPGSIVLLHWDPGLDTEIKDLFAILQQDHLGIASLPVALAHPENFPVTWITPEKTTQPTPPIQPEDAVPGTPSLVNSHGGA
jgi:peptidoglycan/xylan/chitin deacetylase (PgdA/CDA1 family)